MLKLDNVRILSDHQVHGDDTSPTTFYILPRFPRLAQLENGGLALRFVEYSALREEDGNLFGGFVAFDVDLAIPQETLDAIRTKLQEEVGAGQPVTIAPVPWLGGSVKLILQENGQVVEKINAAAVPSLAGSNVACFMLELSQLGTAIFKETLSNGVSSGIQVVYSLDYYARLPEMFAEGTWHASEFYSFFQDVNTEDNFWSEDSYTEVISSSRYKNDVTKTRFEFVGDPNMTPEQQVAFEAQIRDIINAQLAEAVKRNLMQAIADVDPDVKNLNEEQDIEDIRRTVTKTQIADVRVEWREAKAVISKLHPQGSLPTVTSLKDANGNALVWEHYYSKISVDEFLKSLPVNVRVNADFDDLPIHSVEVKLRYPHGPNAKTVEKTFIKADDVEKAEFLVDQGIRSYFRSYAVNFDNSAFVFQAEEKEVDDTDLTVNIDDLGLLVVDVVDGDINFEQVTKANVRVRYEGVDTPIEKFFNLTADEKEFKLREIIEGRRTEPVRYQVTYTMKGDGREITGPESTTDSRLIAVNDPFRALRTVTFRAVGDLTAIIDIGVEATHAETGPNGYRQTHAATLSKSMTFSTWTFPVIDEGAGVLSYNAVINRADGTSETIEVADERRTSIQIGEVVEDFLEIKVNANLVDWTTVKMVNVTLSYLPEEGGVAESTDLLFQAGGEAVQGWKVPLKDERRRGYTWEALYFLQNGDRKPFGPTDETKLTVFLEPS